MKKILLYGFMMLFVFYSCEKGGNIPDPDPDPELPTPGPDPEAPEGTLSLGGLFWDTENTFDYCSFAEALAEAKKQGKRVPTKEEWKALAEEGSAWDDDLLGRWFGPDAEFKEKSEESIFFPAMGAYSHKSDSYVQFGDNGDYWSLPEYNGRGYHATFSKHTVINGVLASENVDYSLRLVQDK